MTTASNERLSVIVLIDALGWEVTKKFGFCRELLPHAGPLETVLGYSSAAIPSLLSGQPPVRHGAWAMYRYDPQRSPFRMLRLLPRLPHALEWRLRVLTKRVVDRRATIRSYYDLYDIPLHLLGFFDIAQRGDPYVPGGMNQETFFDRLIAEHVPYELWTYRTPEVHNFDALHAALNGNARVLFLYTADLDAMMHRVGIFHESVREKLAEYERRIKDILERARELGRETSLYLFSDHGMTDVNRVVDLMSEVEKWGYKAGRRFMAFYDSTMARFWCPPDVRAGLIDRLNETGWGAVVTQEELEAFGCDFADRSYGDVIFLLAPGALMVPSFMGRTAIQAMHGYHPDDRYSKGCFLTNDDAGGVPASIMELKDYLLARVMENGDG
jgi:hypothetical protein